MNIEPPPSRSVEPHQRVAYFDRVMERVVSLPGVSSAAVASDLPLTGSAGGDFSVEGRQASEFKDLRDAEFRSISPDYFQTMGIPLLQGRHFTWQDME